MEPEHRAVRLITLERQLRAPDAAGADLADLAASGTLPGDETLDVRKPPRTDAVLNAGSQIVHDHGRSKSVAMGLAFVLLQ